MAAAKHSAGQRQYNTGSRRQTYVYGNVVTNPEVYPQRIPREKQKPQVKTSRQVRQNRKKALSISPAYAVFLAVAAVAAVFICVGYLRLQSDIVSRAENITYLQEQLADLNEQNVTAYHAAESSVNLETVRAKAIGEMGMVYAAQGNVVKYTGPVEDSVVQYNDIPEDGVLAQSRGVSE